ncbi:hypothetical protein N7453_000051 [Penicillium expansum]|nr:hypothetical protein N7453_000051 [Penicillium expansum]
MATVPDLLQSCLIQFSSLITSDGLARHILEVPLQAWRDELGRLRVWAADIAQTGQSSLDYSLRDASHIKVQILSLLGRVKDLLLDLIEVLEEDADTENQYPREGVEGIGDYPEYDDSITEIQQIYQGLLEAITHLYQMSMMIPQPAHHDRLLGTRKVDAEPFILWAKQHTSNKYPHADEMVIDRLSSMMARQRAILKYRERHHAKSSHYIDLEEEKSTMLPEHPVKDVYKETNEPDDMVSEDGVSETSYNGTLSKGPDGCTKIPPIPPKACGQNYFKCPYCFYTITVRDDRAWAQHILRDLMPYVCVFPDCSTPNRLYESCRQWYAHVQQTHPIPDIYKCPICNQEHLPSVEFQQHVAGHLQELALFYLPRATPEDNESPETRQKEEVQRMNAEQRWRLNRLEQAEKRDTKKEMPKAKSRKGKSKASLEMEEDELDNLTRDINENDTRKSHGVVDNSKKKITKGAAVEEWGPQEHNKQKKKEFRDHLSSMGYSEEEIELIMKKKKKEKKAKKEKKEKKKEETNPTWIRVHHKHLLPETLIAYNLPWDWDEHNHNYIVIKKLITEDFQEDLFSHTRRIREEKVVTQTSHSMTEFKGDDRNKEKMSLARKTSPDDASRIRAMMATLT